MGLVLNNTLIWEDSEVPDGQPLYDFGGKSIGLTGDYDLGSGSTPNYQVEGVKGNLLVLKNSIQNCRTGIRIYFEPTSAYFNGSTFVNNDFNLSFSQNPVIISKNTQKTNITIHYDKGDEGVTAYLAINTSGKNVYFSINSDQGTLLSFFDYAMGGNMAAIKSIVSY